MATEIIEHARASIDHAAWASAFLKTRDPNLLYGVFPFCEKPEHLENRIKGGAKDCLLEIQALFRKLQPYKGGGDGLLYTLHDMCNLSKHALITFMANARAAGQIRGTAFAGPIHFVEPFIMDPVKNEIPYMRVLLGTNPQHNIDFVIYPTIDYREVTSEEPATLVLRAMIARAAEIVSEIETECRRINLL